MSTYKSTQVRTLSYTAYVHVYSQDQFNSYSMQLLSTWAINGAIIDPIRVKAEHRATPKPLTLVGYTYTGEIRIVDKSDISTYACSAHA